MAVAVDVGATRRDRSPKAPQKRRSPAGVDTRTGPGPTIVVPARPRCRRSTGALPRRFEHDHGAAGAELAAARHVIAVADDDVREAVAVEAAGTGYGRSAPDVPARPHDEAAAAEPVDVDDSSALASVHHVGRGVRVLDVAPEDDVGQAVAVDVAGPAPWR